MVDMYKQVSDATAFVRGDGSRLHSLKALEMALYTMTDGEFYHHVSNGRNDFASWVLHVFKQTDLAQKLAQSTNRLEMLSVLDSASRTTPANRTAPAVVSSQKAAVSTKPSSSSSSSVSSKASAAVSKTAGAVTNSGKKFHHKLKGMFKKGEQPVTKQNVNSYQAALATAKITAEAPSVLAGEHHAHTEHLGAHKRTIHEQINHLDSQLAHLTRHHHHTTARENVGSALLEESVKERILDFSLGLIVGLMLGFILAKSLGL